MNTPTSSCTREFRIAGMPEIVLELVIQALLDSRPPFDFTTLSIVATEPSQSELALAAMGLVHRSWTLPSQRALGSRACIEGTKGIKGVLKSPIFGRWTREVSFKWRWGDRDEVPLYSFIYGGPSKEMNERHRLSVETDVSERDNMHNNPDGEPPEIVIPLLVALLQRLGNVRLLSIWTYFAECKATTFVSLLDAIANLGGSLQGLWLAHDRGHVDSDNGCPYLRELCLILPSLVHLRYLSVYEWTTPTYTKGDEENRMAWHSRREFMLPDRSHLGSPLPLPADISPSPTLKSLFLEWESPCLPDEIASWLIQPRGEYSLENLGFVTHLVTGPGPDRLNLGLVPTVSASIANVQKVYLDVDYWTPWSRQEQIPSLGANLVPLITGATTVRDLRVRLSGEFPSNQHPRVPLTVPSTVETLYIKVTEYDISARNDLWLSQLDDYLCHFVTENRLPSLRLVVLTHDIKRQKWARRAKMADNAAKGMWQARSVGANTEAPMDSPSIALRIESLCMALDVRFVYTNNPDLYHFMEMS